MTVSLFPLSHWNEGLLYLGLHGALGRLQLCEGSVAMALCMGSPIRQYQCSVERDWMGTSWLLL